MPSSFLLADYPPGTVHGMFVVIGTGLAVLFCVIGAGLTQLMNPRSSLRGWWIAIAASICIGIVLLLAIQRLGLL